MDLIFIKNSMWLHVCDSMTQTRTSLFVFILITSAYLQASLDSIVVIVYDNDSTVVFLDVYIGLHFFTTNTCMAVLPPASPLAFLHLSLLSFHLSSISFPTPTPQWKSKLKAQACPKINLNGGIKLKAKPREFYYVLMFEPLTWIVLLKYE